MVLLEEPDIKVEVYLVLGFDEESDKALKVAWGVAEKMLERGIWVVVTPSHDWLLDPMLVEASDYPKVFVNGRLMFIGRSPTEEELVNAIEDRLGLKTRPRSEEAAVYGSRGDEGFREVAIAYV
ncbi:hypothetical protein TCELL_1145 [Thermogladius calderae 1633]|uniref:Thioredoxin-like fold domain-containing protein n=1 Tax=Thermogladius calderae (strain DSM 22663 / VKM B-2946 / 1633) TaxID=1184251 RepID=I3TFN0_THEC1|nr:hypothetical protein TCELL_1145 [Thermogladius calderae 1633]